MGRESDARLVEEQVAVFYHKASDATRSVFRHGLGGTFDKFLTARLSGLLYARRADKAIAQAGKIASKIDDSFETLIADAQARQQSRVTLTLKQIRDNTDLPTNYYYQARIGSYWVALRRLPWARS